MEKGYTYLTKFLENENFRYEDNETFLKFKVQMVNYIAFKNDSPFLQIVIMCGTQNADRNKLLELCNGMNSDKFVCKFTLTDDSERILCSYEFLPSEHTSETEWMTLFSILDKNSDELLDRLGKL